GQLQSRGPHYDRIASDAGCHAGPCIVERFAYDFKGFWSERSTVYKLTRFHVGAPKTNRRGHSHGGVLRPRPSSAPTYCKLYTLFVTSKMTSLSATAHSPRWSTRSSKSLPRSLFAAFHP